MWSWYDLDRALRRLRPDGRRAAFARRPDDDLRFVEYGPPTVLTRNVADFDVLLQLVGDARAVFYRA